MIVTWDDSGGWYDHVAPPAGPVGTTWGFRLPVIIDLGVGAFELRCEPARMDVPFVSHPRPRVDGDYEVHRKELEPREYGPARRDRRRSERYVRLHSSSAGAALFRGLDASASSSGPVPTRVGGERRSPCG